MTNYPDYLNDAIEAEEKAWKVYIESGQDFNGNLCAAWSDALDKKNSAYAKYNEECKNELL